MYHVLLFQYLSSGHQIALALTPRPRHILANKLKQILVPIFLNVELRGHKHCIDFKGQSCHIFHTESIVIHVHAHYNLKTTLPKSKNWNSCVHFLTIYENSDRRLIFEGRTDLWRAELVDGQNFCRKSYSAPRASATDIFRLLIFLKSHSLRGFGEVSEGAALVLNAFFPLDFLLGVWHALEIARFTSRRGFSSPLNWFDGHFINFLHMQAWSK